MPVLLDTHAFLWWCSDARELSKRARKMISEEECFLSLASLWEISIKVGQGKLKLPSSFDRYIPEQLGLNGFTGLAIGFRHIARCGELPWLHRDPFDRLLVAQALEEELAVVSRDQVFEQYGIQRIW